MVAAPPKFQASPKHSAPRGEVHDHRAGIGYVDKLVRLVYRTNPVCRLTRQCCAKHGICQTYVGIGAVEIGKAHDHPLNGARGMRRHDQVFLLFAVLPLARMRIARMRLRHTRRARDAVAINAGGQHQTFDADQFRRFQGGPHEYRVQIVGGVRQSDAINDGVHAAGRRARRARLAQIGGKDLGVRHLAERLFQALARTADRAEADAAPVQFRSNRFADGAGRPENRNVLHV